MKVTYNNSFEKSLDGLEESTQAKVLRMVMLLEKYGSELRMPHSKKITDDLYELRIKGKQELRIFYAFRKNSAVLLHKFIKKSQKTPQKEIFIAQNRLQALDQI